MLKQIDEETKNAAAECLKVQKQIYTAVVGTLLLAVENLADKTAEERDELLNEAKSVLCLAKGLLIKALGKDVGGLISKMFAGNTPDLAAVEKLVDEKLSPDGQKVVALYCKIAEIYSEMGLVGADYALNLANKFMPAKPEEGDATAQDNPVNDTEKYPVPAVDDLINR